MRIILDVPKVNQWMVKRGMGTKELAEQMGVSQVTVWRVFEGKRGVGNEFIAGMLHVFDDASFDDLFKIDASRGVECDAR